MAMNGHFHVCLWSLSCLLCVRMKFYDASQSNKMSYYNVLKLFDLKAHCIKKFMIQAPRISIKNYDVWVLNSGLAWTRYISAYKPCTGVSIGWFLHDYLLTYKKVILD